jgi:DinB superfamily
MEMMRSAVRAEIGSLFEQFDAIESDVRALVSGLSEAQGHWHPEPSGWSVAECLDHLATANRVYLEAMRPAAELALAQGRMRRGPAAPGLIGRWFIAWLEPPVKPRLKSKAPHKIRPREEPPLSDAFERFIASHNDTRTFLQRFSAIDLARIRFRNPFVPGVCFSLATGVNVLAAHDRRHVWQAWNVRRAAEHAERERALSPEAR